MKNRILFVLLFVAFSSSCFGQANNRIAKDRKDFYGLLREAISKRDGLNQPVIKLYPIDTDTAKYYSPARHGMNARQFKNSPVAKGLFDHDPSDSSSLVILIDKQLFIDGLGGVGGGGGEINTDTRLDFMDIANCDIRFSVENVITNTQIATVVVPGVACADGIAFDPANSGVTQTNVQDIIDFLIGKVEENSNCVTSVTNYGNIGIPVVSDGSGGFREFTITDWNNNENPERYGLGNEVCHSVCKDDDTGLTGGTWYLVRNSTNDGLEFSQTPDSTRTVLAFNIGGGQQCFYPVFGFQNENDSETNQVTYDTIQDYTALRTFDSNIFVDVVYVNDFTYNFKGEAYTTLGGVFRKVNNGSENGGTIIVSNDGTVWERFISSNTYSPDWWVVGGFDSDGNSFFNDKINEDGISSDSDRWNSCADVAPDGATIRPLGIEYIIDRRLGVKPNHFINLNGATLKMRDAVTSDLTSSAANGSNQLNVQDASNFQIGEFVYIRNEGSSLSNGVGFGEGSASLNHQIIAIDTVNNVLTISGAIQSYDVTFTINGPDTVKSEVTVSRGFLDGDMVVTYLPSMISVPGPGNFKIKNGTIDGNGQNNDHFFDWRKKAGISASHRNHILVENCRLLNHSGEAILLFSGKIINNYYENLYCSFFHCNQSFENNFIIVKDNYTVQRVDGGLQSNICGYLKGHNEVCWGAFSSNVLKIVIEGNVCWNGRSCIGSLGGDDDNAIINRNKFENFQNIWKAIGDIDNVRIENNIFRNCGNAYAISMSFNNTNYVGWTNCKINNNTFVNGRIDFGVFVAGEIKNNEIKTEGDFLFSDITFSPKSVYGMATFVGLRSSVFEGNVITGRDDIYDENIQHGVFIDYNTTVQDSSGVSTFTGFSSNNSISRNTVKNFRYGISNRDAHTGTSNTRLLPNIFASNIIRMHPNSNSPSWGYNISPEGIVIGGFVEVPTVAGEEDFPIILQGLNACCGLPQSYEGAGAIDVLVNGNISDAHSIYYTGGNAGQNHYSLGCIINVPETGSVGPNSADNTLLDTSILPNRVTPRTPYFRMIWD